MDVLRGLSAFSVTPADEIGVVDTAHLQRLVARIAESDVSSIGVLGSTGGYMYLDTDQRERVLNSAVEAAGGVPVLAGIGDLRTSKVLQHARSATSAGASAVLLAPVSYLPLTDDDFAGLVADVANVTDLPICLYNNPGTTHFNISPELTQRLSQIATVKAVKNPAASEGCNEELSSLRAKMLDGFVLGYSGDARINGPLKAGADAWYSVIAGTLPEVCNQIWNARGHANEIDRLHGALNPLWQLFDEFGGIRVVPEMLNLMGLGPVDLPKPLLPLSNPAIARIEAVLDALD